METEANHMSVHFFQANVSLIPQNAFKFFRRANFELILKIISSLFSVRNYLAIGICPHGTLPIFDVCVTVHH
jgi:hypothetical protein